MPAACKVRSCPRAQARAFACHTCKAPKVVQFAKPNVERICQVAGACVASFIVSLSSVQPASAEFRLPPLDKDPLRCEKAFVGNTIGQANAVSDKILDLRFCDFKDKNLSGKTLAGALISEANLNNANMQEAVLTKAYAVKANMENVDLTNAVVDRVDFSGANLKGAKFINTVVTGTTFLDADLTNSVWEDAVVGGEDVKRLCANPSLVGESRLQVGCRR